METETEIEKNQVLLEHTFLEYLEEHILDRIKIPFIYMPGDEEIEQFSTLLIHNKLYNEETGYLICPECHRYVVKYSVNSYENNSTWWCDHCLKDIIYCGYDLEISDKDKYHIYKFWGGDALSVLLNENINKTRKFIASYFKGCCLAKEDKCLYFDIFKEEEKEMGQNIKKRSKTLKKQIG